MLNPLPGAVSSKMSAKIFINLTTQNVHRRIKRNFYIRYIKKQSTRIPDQWQKSSNEHVVILWCVFFSPVL